MTKEIYRKMHNIAIALGQNVQLATMPHCLQGLCQEGHPVDNGKHAPIKVPALGTVQARCAN